MQNWKCHADVVLDLSANVDLVLGINGAGKSALLDAVEFALEGTGKLAGIHTKGDLGLLAITDDADECFVHLAFEGGIRAWGVSRTMDRAGKQTIRLHKAGELPIEGKMRAQESLLREMLGVDEAAVRAVLDARVLLEGPENDRRAILFGATGHAATETQIVACFAKLDLEGADARQAAQDVVRVGWRPAQELAGERRATKGRELSAMIEPIPLHEFRPGTLERGAEPMDLRRWPMADLERRRTANQQALASAIRGEGLDLGKAEEALRLKQDEQKRTEGERDLLVEQAKAEEGWQDLGMRQGALTHAVTELNEAQLGFDACDEQRQKLGDEAAIVVEKPEICPAIPGGFECPATAARLAKHCTKLEAGEADRVESIATADEQLSLADTRLAHAMTKNADAQTLVDAESSRIQSLGRANDRLDAIDGELTTLEATVTEANEQESSSTQVAFHQARLDSAIESIEARKRFDEATAALETFEADQATAIEARERAVQIADALKPTGIESTLLADLVGPLQEKLDEVARFIGPMRITTALDIELHWQGRWKRYQQLSESMRERVAMAVQHAIASLASFPMLIIDRIDHLDPAGKAACMQALSHVSPSYQAVLAMATMQSETPTPAKADGVATWFLTDDGQTPVVRVE